MTFVYLLGIAFLLIVLWLGYGVKRIGSVSRGTPITDRSRPALLLVDLQTVFWDEGPYSDAAKQSAAACILNEVEAMKEQGHPVVAVRQEWSIPSTKAVARLTMKGQAIEGSPGVEIAEVFASAPDHTLVKRVQDALETGELDRLLETLRVGTLRIVGLDLNYCVQKTALAARNRGYDVTVVKAGTLAAGPTDNTVKQMTLCGVAIH